MLTDTFAADIVQPSVLQVIGLGVAAIVMLLFAASAFMANCDPNRNRVRYDRPETRNPDRREGSPGPASSVNGDWRRRSEDNRSPAARGLRQ